MTILCSKNVSPRPDGVPMQSVGISAACSKGLMQIDDRKVDSLLWIFVPDGRCLASSPPGSDEDELSESTQ